MSSERDDIIKIVKSWAQGHNLSWAIDKPGNTEEAINETSGFFTWLIKEGHANIDLLPLINRLAFYLDSKKKRDPDGLYCDNCKDWVPFAEPNQWGSGFICYLCRKDPYRASKK